MIINVPRPEVLQAAFANIQANLDRWDQESWVAYNDSVPETNTCGTTACLAGHIMLVSGTSWEELINMGGISKKALEALGYESTEEPCFCGCGMDFTNWGPDGNKFSDIFFLMDDPATRISFEYRQEAFDIFKAKVSELTGVEL